METKMGKAIIGLIAVVPLVFGLAACSSDDDDSGGSTEISATMEEFEFTPTSWSVAANEEITVNLNNTGSVEHEWVILQPGVTIESEADLPETEEELLADFVYWEDEVEPGDSKTLTFTAPAAGTYQIICAIADHFDAGMNGTLTVEG
jgi:uncharacterized cupredoxin-like copper-binding protein